MASYVIYKHTNLINNKVYIGQTCQPLESRFRNGRGYKDSPIFYNAIKKYGWNNFKTEILERNLTLEEANEKEKYYIKKFNSTNEKYGYNISTGGGGSNGISLSQETKEKISKAIKDKSSKITVAIRCINTGEEFVSLSSAARAYHIGSTSHLKEAADGRREFYGRDPVTKEKLYWEIIKKEI